MFNAFHIISSCSEIPYRHRFAAWVPNTCHNNFPVLFWRRKSWQKGNTNLLQVNHKNTKVRQKSIDKKYLRMHIQPELDTIPKRAWHNSWTHTVFLGKPALGRKRKILTLSAIVINSESFKHRNCSMLSEDFLRIPNIYCREKLPSSDIPFDKDNLYFQVRDKLFVEQRSIEFSFQNLPETHIYPCAFYPLAP